MSAHLPEFVVEVLVQFLVEDVPVDLPFGALEGSRTFGNGVVELRYGRP
ncbi:hypothetical protein ACFWFZ_13870 [Streptomyces sp. NPDC060232]